MMMDEQIETQGWRKRAAAGKAKMRRNAQMAELRAIRAAHIARMEGNAPVEEAVAAAPELTPETPAAAASEVKTSRRKAAADKSE